MKLAFKLNGKNTALDVSGGERLIDLLRERLGLFGTKEGCGKGECGACTVLLNGAPVCSCLLLSSQIVGREITTIEGLARGDKLHPVQAAFADAGAVQCGFCTPGIVLSAVALLNDNPEPSREEIKKALAGNLCRCTGYKKIFEAVELAATNMKRSGGRGTSARSGRINTKRTATHD
jgi:aerobic-type carbon monoxide dehydrogenase small subunit (CoxS/CutS family)